MKNEIKNYAESLATEAEKLLKELVVIPAPCGKEQRKAAYCKEWLESRGALDVYVDEAGNVVYPYEIQHRDRLVVVMAHVDIPFQEEEKLLITQKDRVLEGPGTGASGNLAALLLAAGFFARYKPDLGCGVLFVATTGATGIGNLYGARQLMKDFEGRIGAVISLQGYLGQCVNRFPGMIRYEVKVRRDWVPEADQRMGSAYGGCSQENPIVALSELVCSLNRLPLPSEGSSKHHVSQFQGGGSPDILAEQAGIVYEISSLNPDCLERMQQQAEACFHQVEEDGNQLELRVLAKRPCESVPSEGLVNLAIPLLQEAVGADWSLLSADTEVNLARAAGLPGLTIGTIKGRRPDSQWETVNLDSQRAGVALLLKLITGVCEIMLAGGPLRKSMPVLPKRMPGAQVKNDEQVWHRDGLVFQGDTLLQVLDRHRRELILPSYIHRMKEDALLGMEHLVLWIQDPEQVEDLTPLLKAKQIRLESGISQEKRLVLPFTNIGGYAIPKPFDSFDFEAYDARFARIQDKNLQLEIAISRLLYPVGLTEAYRTQYQMHIKKRFRPALTRLLSGEWHRYGLAPARINDILSLRKMDRFLKKEMVELAAERGLFWEPVENMEAPALIISYRKPGLLPVCKILEDAGRLPEEEQQEDVGRLRSYAHTLFHYVYGHPWWAEPDPLWNIACDIAVNYLTDTLLGPELSGDEEAYLARKAVYDGMLLQEPVLTAENVLEVLRQYELRAGGDVLKTDKQNLFSDDWQKTSKIITSLTSLMQVDDHSQWPVASATEEASGNAVDARTLSEEERHLKEQIEEALKQTFQDGAGMGQRQHQLRGSAGSKAGSREEEARLKKREGLDYQQFLMQFMVCKEDRILDLDSFDPVYYTYGLTHYEDMPFVEPLETKEVNRLEELVIVIDTSGSCQGELVRFFLEETWSVFGHAENFFDQFHVRIMQCDCMVQEDVKLTNLREVEEYMKHLVIRGGGGTDFRPAFRHIRDLRRSGELGHLKGILYFTDGQGVYPHQIPDCETAFIFLEGRYEAIKVPYWAKTLILPLPKDGSLKLEYSGEFRI